MFTLAASSTSALLLLLLASPLLLSPAPMSLQLSTAGDSSLPELLEVSAPFVLQALGPLLLLLLLVLSLCSWPELMLQKCLKSPLWVAADAPAGVKLRRCSSSQGRVPLAVLVLLLLAVVMIGLLPLHGCCSCKLLGTQLLELLLWGCSSHDAAQPCCSSCDSSCGTSC
jgi:hypothetical protein